MAKRAVKGAPETGQVWRYGERCLKVYFDTPSALAEFKRAAADKDITNVSRWVVRIIDEHLHGNQVPSAEQDHLRAQIALLRDERDSLQKTLNGALAEKLKLQEAMMEREMRDVRQADQREADPFGEFKRAKRKVTARAK